MIPSLRYQEYCIAPDEVKKLYNDIYIKYEVSSGDDDDSIQEEVSSCLNIDNVDIPPSNGNVVVDDDEGITFAGHILWMWLKTE